MIIIIINFKLYILVPYKLYLLSVTEFKPGTFGIPTLTFTTRLLVLFTNIY